MTTVSIVIRSFNEEKHIGKLLDGVTMQEHPYHVEVIVVDSGSDDKTVEIAKTKGATIIHIKPEDFSFGRAINLGCQVASGEFIIFASAHVYPIYTTWIKNLLSPFKDPLVGLTYGKQTGNELSKYSELQLFKKWFPNESNYYQQNPFCNNANAAIRSELWRNTKYDESLTGLEDLDWANKLLAQGKKIAYVASAPIVHVHEESPVRVKNRYRREAIALKNILPHQKFSFFDFLKLFISNVISDWFHAALDGVIVKNSLSIIIFRFNQFWGTYLGYRQKGMVGDQLRRRFYYPNRLKKAKMMEEEEGSKIEYH